MTVTSSMRHCIMMGYNDVFKQKANMFSEHLRDGDMINDSYMHDAARFNNIYALELLLEKGCIDPSRQNVGGNTPLHVAAYNGHNESVEMLLSNKSDPSVINEKGELPLHRAVSRGHIDTVKLLIPVSDINITCKDNVSALHTAARTGNVDMITLLMNNGADTKLLDSKNRSVLHYGAVSGDIPTLAFLVKAGLSVTSVDNNNRKPRNTAFNNEAIQFLIQCEQVADQQDDLISVCDSQIS
ncbi:putative ankyrin repeat protein RF_0381 [Bolinopsis microptera]|uniref:putative ankyrin repeat protein RF_0381 n=1 Tax=Bolinopsis microptera TaxID=2820187 RepID=UPI003078DD65